MSEWIEWKGGRCPVAHGTRTRVKFRSGTVRCDDEPEGWAWGHYNVDSDIVAYAIAEEAPKSTRAAIHSLLDEREKTHGEFYDVAEAANGIRILMGERSDKVLAEAQTMIASKLGRVAAGNDRFEDHWRDIAGYATLAADRCKALNEEPK